MSNICCRIFREQINLLKSLPNQEEAKTVLYQAVMSAYNQFENQNENQVDYQNENQNECAYISISLLSINILNLLKKNIIFKEYSSNCGGRREGSGRPKKNNELEIKSVFKKPTIEEITEYCAERNNNINPQQFFNFYESKGWKIGKTPMKDWKAAVRTWESKEKPKKTQETVFVDENMRIDEDMPEFKDMTFDACCKASEWLLQNMYCQTLAKDKFIEIVRKFK